MPEANPFSPPQTRIVDSAGSPDIDIDGLNVSDTWKKRFKALKEAGGPAMKNAKNMSREARKKLFAFNIIAFLFGPLYYLAKGMWKKGITLFVVSIIVILLLEVLLAMIGFGKVGKSLGYGAAAIFAIRANIDYYKKMVLGDNGWW